MQIDGLFSKTVELLGRNIDIRARNQNLLASNIANAETPNYIPKSLDFEGELQGALKGARNGGNAGASRTNPAHIPIKGAGDRLSSVTGKIVETPAATPGKDGNAVELENEMGKLLENQIMYNASVQILSKKFEGIITALKEGK